MWGGARQAGQGPASQVLRGLLFGGGGTGGRLLPPVGEGGGSVLGAGTGGPPLRRYRSPLGGPGGDRQVGTDRLLENIPSERQLLRAVADRLSWRRYIGYDIDEAVPDHSTLARARDRLGRELFQAVFDHSVRLCQAAGMVWGCT
ncbi:MAG: transposase, partial [Chloroflexota bacterium]